MEFCIPDQEHDWRGSRIIFLKRCLFPVRTKSSNTKSNKKLTIIRCSCFDLCIDILFQYIMSVREIIPCLCGLIHMIISPGYRSIVLFFFFSRQNVIILHSTLISDEQNWLHAVTFSRDESQRGVLLTTDFSLLDIVRTIPAYLNVRWQLGTLIQFVSHTGSSHTNTSTNSCALKSNHMRFMKLIWKNLIHTISYIYTHFKK